MRSSYGLQHQVLPMLVKSLRPDVLKEKIASRDQKYGEDIIKAAMELLLLSNIDYEVEFAKSGDYDFMVYDMHYDIARVTDCRYIVVCAVNGNRYFTVEYSYDHAFELCEWREGAHCNYDTVSRDTDMQDILDKIADILKE